MQKNRILGLVALIIVAGVIVYFIGPGSSGGTTLKSSDGIVELSIPDGAMPDEASIEDITIEKDESSDAEFLVYNLSPDGLEFKKPISITLTTPLEGGEEIPLLLHQSGEGDDVQTNMVDGASVSFDQEENRLTVTGEISHFSRIALWQVRGIFGGRVTSAATTHVVDDSFVFSAEIGPTGRTARFRDDFGFDEFSYQPGSLWSIRGSISTQAANRIVPWAQEFEGRQGLTSAQKHTVRGTFTCNREGSERLSTGGNSDVAARVDYTLIQKRYSTFGGGQTLQSEREHRTHTFVGVRETHTCEEPEPEEPEQEFQYIGPQYFIVCPSGATFTGYPQRDENGNEITDGLGNPIDSETGQAVICPGG